MLHNGPLFEFLEMDLAVPICPLLVCDNYKMMNKLVSTYLDPALTRRGSLVG